MKKIYNIISKALRFSFFLNHDNSLFFSPWNFLRIKHLTLKHEKKSLNFFNYHYTNSLALGPLQKDEAILLFGMISCMKPKCIVELGFHKGHSAMTMLNAMDSKNEFTTIDIDPNCKKIFEKSFSKRFPKAKILINDMSKIDFNSIFQKGVVDFVFFDAVHDFEINLRTYNNIKTCLSDSCIIMVHDTGLWHNDYMEDVHHTVLNRIKSKRIDDNLYAHQIDERKFSNYLVEIEGFQSFHIHSINVLRHGLTCLHKQNNKLSI